MPEVFKERVSQKEEEPSVIKTTSVVPDDLAGNETKLEDPLTAEQKILDIWEGEHRRKYVTEYFDVGNVDGEFGLKMQTSQIDKYVKGELEKRSWENNIENWEKVLQEIEQEIGSANMELYARISKITNYIQVLNKLYKAKELKEKFLAAD